MDKQAIKKAIDNINERINNQEIRRNIDKINKRLDILEKKHAELLY